MPHSGKEAALPCLLSLPNHWRWSIQFYLLSQQPKEPEITSVFQRVHNGRFSCAFLPNESQIRVDFILNGFTMILQLKERLPSLLNPRRRVRKGPFCWCSLRFHCALIQEKLRSGSKSLQQQLCDVSPARARAPSLHSQMPPVNGAIPAPPRSMKAWPCQATFAGFGFPPKQPPALWIFLFQAFQ